MKEPLVYILLLNYNRLNDTIECVNSLKRIHYSNYKIVIVDNCSTDNSFPMLEEKLDEIELHQTGENVGYTGGINFGLKIIKEKNADYILVLNNDTIVEKDFLNNLIVAMEKNSAAGAACGTILAEHDQNKIWYAGGSINKLRGIAIHDYKDKNISFLPSENVITEFVTGCMILLRNEILETVGYEDERFFMYLDDIEYSLRIQAKGYLLLYVPKSIIYHKVFGEKENPFKLYYSVRNRLLLINTAFEYPHRLVARLYFYLVIIVKLILWRVWKTAFFQAGLAGINDYLKGNFGKGRGHNFLSKY